MDCSDKTRRSMNEALRTGELNEEALAFLNGKPSHPVADRTSAARERLPASTGIVPMAIQSRPAARIQNAVSEHAQVPVAGVGTVSITVRMPGSLPPRLLRASVERKLRREIPFTQQEIVAEALTLWLEQHGYLS